MRNPFRTLAYKLGGVFIKLGWVFIGLGERIEFKCYPNEDDCTVYNLDDDAYTAIMDADHLDQDGDLNDLTENPGDYVEPQDHDSY